MTLPPEVLAAFQHLDAVGFDAQYVVFQDIEGAAWTYFDRYGNANMFPEDADIGVLEDADGAVGNHLRPCLYYFETETWCRCGRQKKPMPIVETRMCPDCGEPITRCNTAWSHNTYDSADSVDDQLACAKRTVARLRARLDAKENHAG